ncbi:hypothetical protein ASG43_06135 [Aureimonas sp. Leaf454]|uniref:GspMb/PilO family protein n=1 Tax=Aureimonas sp. Leaf454 TaxID=1736381 RepID=UPI0006FD3008|nr:GspMb/PilO family protein [Aureimonas sp. Leaf454]KQT50838.1 hypothetical protein ASG43_06135 [Aureimonas sp. Leaf454]
MTPFTDHPALQRGAALLLLGAVLLVALPPVLAPLRTWLAARDAIADEQRVLDRLALLDARRSGVLAAASAEGPAPFIIAADRSEAANLLSQRVASSAPIEAVRIEALEHLADAAADERPGAPVRLLVRFEATPSGLYTFLRDLESGVPAIRVGDLTAAATSSPGAPVVLAGRIEVSAAFLLTEPSLP